MFIRDITHRQTYLNGYKNIVWEEFKDYSERDQDETIKVHPELMSVVEKLMKARPLWRYKSAQHLHHGSAAKWITELAIYEGDESLGMLEQGYSYNTSSMRFYFDNFRVKAARKRNTKTFSSDPAVAAKRILKMFHLKTPKERAAEAFTKVRKGVNEQMDATRWPLRRAMLHIEAALKEYAVRHWDTIQPRLGNAVVGIDLPALHAANEGALAIAEALDNTKGVLVQIETNGTYFVARATSNSYETNNYGEDTLPFDLRGSLALLKMLEPNSYVENLGMRVAANLYFVMDKKG